MLTSRERVMMAVNHREPDRIPLGLGGHRSSGIGAIACNKLKEPDHGDGPPENIVAMLDAVNG
mgnify:CR=1 FL=1